MQMRLLLPFLAIAAIGVAAPALHARQAVQPTATDLAAQLQKRYDSIRDFTADFDQQYRGLLQRQTAGEHGKLLVKKPSRVRFTYDAPERKVFVSDGTTFKSYYQKEGAGSEYPLPKDNEASTAMMFLAGHCNLARDFTPGMATGAPPTEWHLGLVPKTRQTDFNTLTLFVDRSSLALLGFMTTDDQGTNTIRFKNLKENTGLSDSAFAFSFPPGTAISR